MHYRTLITASDLLVWGPPPNWALVDCRFDLADKRWGEAAYRHSHIPGACYAHLERDLSGPVQPGTGRHPLPHWREFSEKLGGWGIYPDTQVVVYDQNQGAYAARLWWMLRLLGHRNVALLDGGWTAWLEVGGAGSGATPVARGEARELFPGTGEVTTQQLERNLTVRELTVVDARSSERFCGEREPIDAVAGHVPGALNRPYTDNLRHDGTLLAPALLRAQWAELLGEAEHGAVVHMCGSGVTACQNLLAMEVAGLTGSRLYVGSWSEWIRENGRPVAVGPG